MKARPKQTGPSPLPSREEVAAFIASAPGKVGKREVARAFNLGSADRIWLKDILRQLEDAGTLARRGKRLRANSAMPSMLVAEITGRDRDGDLVAEPTEWDAENGPKPRIVIVPGRRIAPGMRAAGIGDRALVRIDLHPSEGGAHAGRIVKVLPKERTDILGMFRALPSGGGRIVSVDKKALGREVMVAEADRNGAAEGDLVSGALTRSSSFGLPEAKVREVLGSLKSEKAVSLVALHAHNIPHVFPPDVLAEAEATRPFTNKGREDWRDLPLVTIDPPDAKDHDDAVHAALDTDPENPGGFVLTVAIADVAAYVRPGSALDREALKRGNSVYFPDRVVPMLPERISNDLCSLRQGEPRPALAVRMIIAADGRKRRHSFHRVTMRSAAKLSYAQAQASIDGQADDATGPLLDPVLRPLWAAYDALGRARDKRGPLFLDLPERKIILNADGQVDRVHVPERLAAHRLIEEFMILANVAAAEALEAANSPLVYRVHDEPSLEKMRALGEVLASVGHKLPKAGALKPALFNGILRQFAGSEHEPFINEVVLRSQAQAVYAAENLGHFGLNLRRYAHFTSPIRRYADLIVHRALIRAFGLGDDGLPASTTTEQLSKVGEEISAAERRAMAAERDTIDRLIAFHLADQIGATFAGRVSGVVKSGLFVKLAETGADGFIPAATIGADYYRYEERQHALVGDRSGETYRLGDTVEVKLVEAAPVAGALRFEMLSEGSGGRAKNRSGPPKSARGFTSKKRVVDLRGGANRKRGKS